MKNKNDRGGEKKMKNNHKKYFYIHKIPFGSENGSPAISKGLKKRKKEITNEKQSQQAEDEEEENEERREEETFSREEKNSASKSKGNTLVQSARP